MTYILRHREKRLAAAREYYQRTKAFRQAARKLDKGDTVSTEKTPDKFSRNDTLGLVKSDKPKSTLPTRKSHPCNIAKRDLTVPIRNTSQLPDQSVRKTWPVEKCLTELCNQVDHWLLKWGGMHKWPKIREYCERNHDTPALGVTRHARECHILEAQSMSQLLLELWLLPLPNDSAWLADLIKDAFYCQMQISEGLAYLGDLDSECSD